MNTAPAPGFLRGVVLMIAGMACLAASDAASKLLVVTVPVFQVSWMRFIVFTPVAVLLALKLSPVGLRSQHPRLQVLRGFVLLGSSFGFVGGMQYLPLAQATAVFFIAPLLVILWSIPLLREMARPRQWLAVIFGLIGVLIVVRPGGASFHPALGLPVISAASWAFALVIARRTALKDGPFLTLSYTALVGLAVTTLLMPFVAVPIGWREAGLGLLTAVFFGLAQLLTILSVRHASANELAPYAYLQLIWAAVLGFVVFHDVPDLWTFVGAAVIVASGLVAMARPRG